MPLNNNQIEYVSPEVIEYDFIENTLGAEAVLYESYDGFYS